MTEATSRWKILFIVVLLGIMANLAPGLTVIAWKLPFFLDVTGTIAVTLLCGWRVGATTGVLSFLVGGVIYTTMPYFVFSQFLVAVVTGISASRGGFRKIPGMVATGIVMGFVAALASAPAVALAFGSAPAAGQTAFTVFLADAGDYLHKAFASSDFWIEPADKVIQCGAAMLILKALPKNLLQRVESPASYLKANGLV